MKIIICTRGIPASGKTTWANKELGKLEGGFYINKDLIREEDGLFPAGYFYSKENEKIVMEKERADVAEAIRYGINKIIIDNTHLGINNKHLLFYKDLAKKNGYEFKIKDFFVIREEAIKRDLKRKNPVGVAVIDKMIKIAGNGGYPLNPIFNCKINNNGLNAYIFDIDGTLAFIDNKRSPYDGSKVDGDRCNIFLKEILNILSKKNHIIICSGRSEEYRAVTEKWLKDNGISSYVGLYMRKEGDNRKDDIIKKEIYDNYIKNYYNVIGVFDDRQQVVDMWRLKLGLPTYQVWYGNF